MAYNETTSYLSLPLPHPRNTLREDCPRIRESLQELDDFAKETNESLSRLSAADTSLNQAIQGQQKATAQALSEEKTERANADSALNETIATLRSQLASLAETVSKINPWDIFPMRVPIAVDGVTFGGSDGRRAIMPGETEPRENWVLCDGGSDGKDGTVPDLRGRMILGASETHQAGDTGGSETHSHSLSGTVGKTTLTVEQTATHKHTIKNSKYKYGTNGEGSYGFDTYFPLSSTGNLIDVAGGSQPHTHGMSGDTGAASSLPPHYALAFVMRVS